MISLLIGGQIPKWDLSKLRPSGARLKTFGGQSGEGKRIDIIALTPTYSLKFNIRSKNGGILPTHIMCDYKER